MCELPIQMKIKAKVKVFEADCCCNFWINENKEAELELFLKRVTDAIGVAKEVTIRAYRCNGSNILSFDIKNDTEWFALNIQPIGETDLLPNGFLGDVYVQDWIDAHYLSHLLLQELGFADAKVDISNHFLAFSKRE